MKTRNGLIRILGSLALTLGVTLGTSEKADAGMVRAYNYNSSGVFYYSMIMQNISGSSEGYDIYDGDFPPFPDKNALEIYSMVEGNKLSIDARPIDTPGWDFFLGVKGTATCDNSLIFMVSNATNLPNMIYAYDTLNPSVKYTIPKDGSFYPVPLPNLVNQSGEYAHWRLDIPEPSTLVLLGTAGIIGAGALLHSKRKKKLEEMIE